jgi:hypothetical protein
MKQPRIFALLVVMCLATLLGLQEPGYRAIAQQAALLTDDFESYPADYVFPTCEWNYYTCRESLGWQEIFGPGLVREPSRTIEDAGNKALRFGVRSVMQRRYSLPDPGPNSIIYRFRIRFPDPGGGWIAVWLGRYSGEFPSHGFFRFDYQAGTLFGPGRSRPLPLSDGWHRVRIELDFLRDVGSIWVDDEQMFADIPAGSTPTFHFEPAITFENFWAAGVLVDDVTVHRGGSDTALPVISGLSGNVRLGATTPSGAVTTWPEPSAHDEVDGPVAVTCAPASGSVFPVGTTIVTCSAVDSAGNRGTDRFTVTVTQTSPPLTDGGRDYALFHYASHHSPEGGYDNQSGVRVFDLATGGLVANISFSAAGTDFHQAFNSQDGRAVYLVAATKIARIDLSTWVLEMIEVPGTTRMLRGFASREGPVLYLVEGTQLIHFDGQTRTVVKTVPLPVNPEPTADAAQLGEFAMNVEMSPDRETLYLVTMGGTTFLRLTAASVGSGARLWSLDVPVSAPGYFSSFAVSPGGDYVLLGSFLDPLIKIDLGLRELGERYVAFSGWWREINFLSNDRVFLAGWSTPWSPACGVADFISGAMDTVSCAPLARPVWSAVAQDRSRLVFVNGVTPSTFGHPTFVILDTDTLRPVYRSFEFDALYTGWVRTAAVSDTTPPEISGVPLDMTVEATSPAGAVATWVSPTAVDDVSGIVPVVCNPASRSVFPLGPTVVRCSAKDAAGNKAEGPPFTVTVVDTTPPEVHCNGTDTDWHGSNVVASCTASDTGIGLADPSDSSFTLSTNVAAGEETADAATGSRSVCDKGGLCTTAGPLAGLKVDRRQPTIAITNPAGGTVLLNGAMTASYTCTDGGSGVASCIGSVANGASLNTATPGEKTLAVTATDLVGNQAVRSAAYTVAYGVGILYDQNVAKKSGSTYPIKIALRDAAGANVSSPDVTVTAEGISLISDTALGPVDDSGNANPDGNFRFLDGSYIFNLSTKGLRTGTYLLYFRCGADPTLHTVQFQVR